MKFTNLRLSVQRGLTMVELLVAMVLMTMVTLATVTLYSVTSDSYRTVDADQELQNNARYAMDVISYAARHAGYQERVYVDHMSSDVSDTFFPTVKQIDGVDNSKISNYSTDSDFGTVGGNNGENNSDVLTVRFFGSMKLPGNSAADTAMVSCLGKNNQYPSGGSAELMVSSFSIKVLDGEYELYCKARNTNNTNFDGQPIVPGMETFQVMYGIATADDKTVPERWLHANQLVAADWPRIMAVRVGFVLRGKQGSAPVPTSALTYYPMGQAFTGADTSAGMVFTAPIDGRLRRAYTATFKVRNNLSVL